MKTGPAEAIQHQIEWLRLTQTEAEQLMLQKFFLEEVTGLHHLHLLLEHYAFIVWEMMTLLEHINLASTALNNQTPQNARIKEIAARMLMIASSDINIGGKHADLLAVFRKGMDSCGANSTLINTFVARLRRGESDAAILRNSGAGSGIMAHVQHTRQLLKNNELHLMVAALCYAPRLPKYKSLLRLIDQLDRKLPVLLMRIRYYFDLEIMFQEEIFSAAGGELMSLLCADDPEKWAASKQIITETAFSRAGVLADVRAAIKRS